MLTLWALLTIVVAQPRHMEWNIEGTTREALVYPPAQLSADESPVIFAFHGHGGTAANAARTFHFQELWPAALVVYMQGIPTPGPLTDPEGKRNGWQHGPGEQGDRDLKFFDAVLATLGTEYKIDRRRIYATGHSNGGGFTYLLWAQRPDVFAALAPSAAGGRSARSVKPKPAMHIAGENDMLVRFANQQRTMQVVRQINGCADSAKPWAKNCLEYPSTTGTPFVSFIHPGGHRYPSEAPALIVRFFQEHALTESGSNRQPARPAVEEGWNVVLILADDLGWTDLACFGSELYETPNLDGLARDGMRFTQNYSACTVCSPTRAALLTGKYPARLHITDWIPGLMPDNPKLLVPEWRKNLPLEETTLAELFQAAGYETASIGKWHLGTEPYYPEKQGFGRNIAGTDKPSPATYFAPWKIPTLTEGNDREYLTDRLGDEAVRFIEAAKDRRFFLYLPHFAVHTPIQAPAALVRKYDAKLRPGLTQSNSTYAAMVESLDATVGRIRAKLQELQLEKRTIVVFTSDNGGRIPTTSNKPLRFGKASAYEGGVRVPLIVHWPGVTASGSESSVPVITMDLFPTLVEMAGLTEPGATGTATLAGQALAQARDGVSLVPLLRRTGTIAERDLFWHYPHHQHYQLGGTTPYAAIRRGDWKLIEFFNDMHVELYNLRDDIGEQHDRSSDHEALREELRNRLHSWRAEIGAQMPTPNPDYDPARPEYTPPARNKTKAPKKTPAKPR